MGEMAQYQSVENRGMHYGPTYILSGERKSTHEVVVCGPGFGVDINCASKTTAFFVRSILTLLGRYSIGVYLRMV
jgi:hypothetical protein